MTRLDTALLCTALACALASAGARAMDVPAAKAGIDQVLDQDYPRLEALYRDIHQHPELGFQETRTAALLAARMRALGFAVTEKVGRTGVVAVYRNGPGPTVLVRTELDALPMEEKTGLPYASRARATWLGKETYVDHACGHDIHMAASVGTATALVRLKDRWHGTLVFVAQPAEEEISGARAMLDDGFFQRFGKPDYGFALHVGPGVAGQVYYKPGVLTSNSDTIDLVFHGRGGHGSMPAATIDPVLIAARFVVDVQSVVSREIDPARFGVITVGAFNAGNAGNIIPDSAHLRGTVRSYDDEVRERLLAGIRRTAEASAAMAGAPAPDIDLDVERARAVVNDAALAERTGKVFAAAFGANAVPIPAPGSASEDYSEFIAAGVPSLYFAIGGLEAGRLARMKAAGERIPVNHSPDFAPDPQPSIRTGVEAMALAVMDVMQPEAGS